MVRERKCTEEQAELSQYNDPEQKETASETLTASRSATNKVLGSFFHRVSQEAWKFDGSDNVSWGKIDQMLIRCIVW